MRVLWIVNPLRLLKKKGVRGYDGAKKIKGRKRHILTDTQGFVLYCHVGVASQNDRAGLDTLMERGHSLVESLEIMWADMGYQSQSLKHTLKARYGIELEIVKRPRRWVWVPEDTPEEQIPRLPRGFQVQPKRWIVERTFAWLNRNRRLSKDYEELTATSEQFIYLAMGRLLLKRFSRF